MKIKTFKKVYFVIILNFIVLFYSENIIAQQIPTDTSFDVNTFWPQPGPYNYLSTGSAIIAPHLQVGFGLMMDYIHTPLYLQSLDGNQSSQAVSYQLSATFMWNLGLFNFLQVGMALPAVIVQGGDGISVITDGDELSFSATRDLRFYLKGRILGKYDFSKPPEGFFLSLAAGFSAPTGDTENFSGDRNFVFEPLFIAEYFHPRFSVSLNFGGRLREDSSLANFRIGNELIWSLAGRIFVWRKRLAVLAEYSGIYGLGSSETLQLSNGDSFVVDPEHLIMEVKAGVSYIAGRDRDIVLSLAGGAGLNDDPLNPAFRIIASFSYDPNEYDLDNDGIPDHNDSCSNRAEDRDNFEDEDGCPDTDNDMDGINDRADQCPDEAEDMDQFEDTNGCPDADNDRDGVGDDLDRCSGEAEDADQFEDEDGCPDPEHNSNENNNENENQPAPQVQDTHNSEADAANTPNVNNTQDTNDTEYDSDNDRIPDHNDSCPNRAEDRDNFEDEDGCPDTDNDRDGVLDDNDRCPDDAEDIDQFEDEDGCPDPGHNSNENNNENENQPAPQVQDTHNSEADAANTPNVNNTQDTNDTENTGNTENNNSSNQQ